MGFSSYGAYQVFSRIIKEESRFALNSDAKAFLREFRKQAKARIKTLAKEQVLYRCVKDYYEEIDEKAGSVIISGSSEQRVLPDKKFACEGRVNPSGIVYLYLASSQITAVSEVRPWVQETVTIATFKTCRELRLADLSIGHSKHHLEELTFPEMFGEVEISQEKIDKCVWNDIDSAFSNPTTRTDTGAEYAPTQILTETLQEMGCDGVVYKSAFGGEKGYNVALFNLDDASIITANAYKIKSVDVSFEQIGNAWYRKQDQPEPDKGCPKAKR